MSTRKQLREVLEISEIRRKTFEDRAAAAEKKFDSIGEQLKADGWIPKYASGIYIDITPPIVGWTAPDRDAERKALEEKTRRETLEKVIDALELPYVAFTEFKLGEPDSGKRYYAAGKLWDDINTALEHREAEKHAETARKTAEKVAGLAKRDGYTFTFIPVTDEDFDPKAPKVGDLTKPTPKKKPTKPTKKEGE